MLTSMKSTLALINSLTALLVASLVVMTALNVYERQYAQSVSKNMNALVENLSEDLLQFAGSEPVDIFSITTTMLRLDRYENVKFALVTNSEGNIIQNYVGAASLQSSNDNQLTIPHKLLAMDEGTYRSEGDITIIKTIGYDSLSVGKLILVFDIAETLKNGKAKLLYSVLPISIAIALLAIILIFIATSRILLPLLSLIRFAQKVQETHNYATPIEVTGKKEVSDLTIEIRDMMSTIHEEEIKNKQYNNELTEQKQQLEKLANFDSLTGLANRAYFLEQMETWTANYWQKKQSSVLFYIDLDGFKTVNDSFGHHIGDKLLIEAAARLKRQLHPGVRLCRFGGDEFLCFFDCNDDVTHSIDLAKNLVNTLHQTYSVDQWTIDISASIGIAIIDANSEINSPEPIGTIVMKADTAMYVAKGRGKNTAVVFDESMLADNQRILNIANALPEAIRNREMSLFYQAKVDRFENVVGFEGLIRWISKEMGFVSPNEFISVAEKSGKIRAITDFVIERVCIDIHKLIARYGKNIMVSVNLSSHDLKDEELADFIQDTFEKHTVDATNIQFEITESAYLENFDVANRFINSMTKLGCSIALDDFGTGYSSLSYLTKIEIDTLKIDKEFVDGLGINERDTTVTTSIIHLAKKLNLKICAEGVENEMQASLLIEQDCDQLQGYLFAKPKPLSELIIDTDCVIS